MAFVRTVFPKGQEPEVKTANLCIAYGCKDCPGIVTETDGEPIFCIHECHRKPEGEA